MKNLQHPQIIHPTLEIISVNKEVNKYLGKLKINKIKVIFFGSDIFVIPILQALEDNFEVSAVVSASDSPVANYFKGPMFTSGNLDENFKSQILNFKFDLFVVASYGKIIPEFILKLPKYGALNVHPSLLPKYRGPSPVQTTILNGDKVSGVTIIKMDEKMDHGPVIAAGEISLSGKEDFNTLITKLFQIGADILVKMIPNFVEGKIKLRLQDHRFASYCNRVTKQDGYFDISNPPPPTQLDRMVRAYYPWPGVWTKWRVKAQESRVKEKIVKFLPGGLIQMEGKKAIPYKDFLNGYPDFPGFS